MGETTAEVSWFLKMSTTVFAVLVTSFILGAWNMSNQLSETIVLIEAMQKEQSRVITQVDRLAQRMHELEKKN